MLTLLITAVLFLIFKLATWLTIKINTLLLPHCSYYEALLFNNNVICIPKFTILCPSSIVFISTESAMNTNDIFGRPFNKQCFGWPEIHCGRESNSPWHSWWELLLPKCCRCFVVFNICVADWKLNTSSTQYDHHLEVMFDGAWILYC